MQRALSIIDWGIRISSVLVVGTLGMTLLVFASIMGTDSGTSAAMASSAALLLGGAVVLFALILTAIHPDWIEQYIPGPVWLGKVLVRVPAYFLGTAGLALFLRLLWLESLAPLFQ